MSIDKVNNEKVPSTFLKEHVEKTPYYSAEVKKGDNLWSIVKNTYQLEGKTQSEKTLIANIVKKLKSKMK